jgi:hypothetical protein
MLRRLQQCRQILAQVAARSEEQRHHHDPLRTGAGDRAAGGRQIASGSCCRK